MRRDWAALERERQALSSGVEQIRRRAPHFGLTMTSALTWANGGSAYDPAVLSLRAWVRAAYSGSPWVGVASAGSSGNGTRNLSDATPPATGTALNGLATADFNGSTQKLANATTMNNFVSTAAGFFVVLFNADAASADAGASTPYNNPALITSATNGYLSFTYSTSGVRLGAWNGASFNSVAAAAATGGWHIGWATWDATTFYVAVDSGSYTTLAHTIDAVISGDSLRVGNSYNGAKWFDGRIAEIMIGASTLTTQERADIKSYINARYALAL